MNDDTDSGAHEFALLMRSGTESLTVPPGFLRRVQEADARRARRNSMGGVAVAVVGATAALPLLMQGSGGNQGERAVAAPAASSAAPAEPLADGLGPSDTELLDADHFQSSSTRRLSDGQTVPESHRTSRRGSTLTFTDGEAQEYTDGAYPYGEAVLTFAEVLSLPADPADLSEALRSAGADTPGSLRPAARELLAAGPVRTGTRLALRDLLSQEPGAVVRPAQKDSLGRPSVVVTLQDDAKLTELHFDEDGGRLLEERISPTDGSWALTTWTSWGTAAPQEPQCNDGTGPDRPCDEF